MLFGSEGIWWITILGVAGLPLLALCLVVGWFFAKKIAATPWWWSICAGLGAVLISTVFSVLATGWPMLGLASLPVAVVAPIVFRFTLRAVMPAALPADN